MKYMMSLVFRIVEHLQDFLKSTKRYHGEDCWYCHHTRCHHLNKTIKYNSSV